MPPILFISYSHDSEQHREKVLALSERLRDDGFETRLDQYVNGTPQEKWPRWMMDRLDEATHVLVICTQTYYRRFREHQEPGVVGFIKFAPFVAGCADAFYLLPCLFDSRSSVSEQEVCTQSVCQGCISILVSHCWPDHLY
jgi:hypothetical protein